MQGKGHTARNVGSMDYSNVGPRSLEKIKKTGEKKVEVMKGMVVVGKILETNNWMVRPITHIIQLTREKEKEKFTTYQGWSLKGVRSSSLCPRRGRKDDSNIAPFHTTRLIAYTHLLLNVMRSNDFLLFLILTLSWCLKSTIRLR